MFLCRLIKCGELLMVASYLLSQLVKLRYLVVQGTQAFDDEIQDDALNISAAGGGSRAATQQLPDLRQRNAQQTNAPQQQQPVDI